MDFFKRRLTEEEIDFETRSLDLRSRTLEELEALVETLDLDSASGTPETDLALKVCLDIGLKEIPSKPDRMEELFAYRNAENSSTHLKMIGYDFSGGRISQMSAIYFFEFELEEVVHGTHCVNMTVQGDTVTSIAGHDADIKEVGERLRALPPASDKEQFMEAIERLRAYVKPMLVNEDHPSRYNPREVIDGAIAAYKQHVPKEK